MNEKIFTFYDGRIEVYVDDTFEFTEDIEIQVYVDCEPVNWNEIPRYVKTYSEVGNILDQVKNWVLE